MRIAQWRLDDAPLYEEKCQALDAEWLARDHEVTAGPDRAADLVHIYGPRQIPAHLVRRFPLPYVANGAPKPSRFPFGRPRMPTAQASPPRVPEAVDPRYTRDRTPRIESRKILGAVARRNVRRMIDATAARIARFRDDLEWVIFERAPGPEDLDSVALWVDPALDDDDRDGFGAEALASGLVVVASRTAANLERFEGGASALLVPPDDPNELTHAILGALFKPESVEATRAAAVRAKGRFDPARRRDALVALYEEVLR